MSGLEGKSILVTGAAGGIGKATAIMCAENGAKLIIGDIDEARLVETTETIKSMGAEICHARCDIATEADVANLVDMAINQYGSLDGAVNNAGIGNHAKTIGELSLDEWKEVFDVNAHGTFLCLKHELRVMLPAGEGAIVNVASAAGLIGYARGAEYVSSKHAIVGLTKCAALEYSEAGIRVNAVAPGTCDTDLLAKNYRENPEVKKHLEQLTPVKRLAEPSEIAAAILFLLSPAASFIHGTTVAVDGALTAA